MCFRLFLKSHSGTAGRQSSLVINGADFSTKDMDNDNCMCKCALMLTGGKCSRDVQHSDGAAKQLSKRTVLVYDKLLLSHIVRI